MTFHKRLNINGQVYDMVVSDEKGDQCHTHSASIVDESFASKVDPSQCGGVPVNTSSGPRPKL